MGRNIYIFRHGETDYNAEKRAQGWIDIPLNDNGKKQAVLLAQKLADIKIDCIYSSPLLRALSTAEIVANKRQIKIIVNDGLKERYFGAFEGRIIHLTDEPADTPIDTNNDVINVPRVLSDDNDIYVPGDGEDYDTFKQRVCNSITDIVKNTDFEDIGIATHGCFIRMLVQQLTGIKLPRGSIPVAEYLRMRWDGNKITLSELPDWLSARSSIYRKNF